jgi:hypothetical protein
MSRFKRLFIIREGKNGRPLRGDDGKVIYFNDKMLAKRQRQDDQVVSYGPDHKLYKGQAGEEL